MKSKTYLIAMVVVVALSGAAAATAEEDGKMIATGVPFVDFELPAHDGTTVASKDLEGRPYLLFYYPKADTPG